MTDDLDKALTASDALSDLAFDGNETTVARAAQLAVQLAKGADGEFSIPRVDEGEPVFVLVGRDPVFSALAEAWAYLRSGHIAQAKQSMAGAVDAVTIMEPLPSGHPQVNSAFRVAEAGRDYRKRAALRGSK